MTPPLAFAIAVAFTGLGGNARAPGHVGQAHAAKPKASVSHFIFVRHCEKDTAGQDPPLTAEGQARAKALADALQNERIDAIYATPFKRTQMTVQPLAETHHLRVAIVQGHNDRKFASQLVHSHKNQNVVIASHINVIPDVVKHMGIREPIELAENSYGDMFMVEVDGEGHATMTRSRFGQ